MADVVLQVGAVLDPAADSIIQSGIDRVARSVRAVKIKLDPNLDSAAVEARVNALIKTQTKKVFVDIDFRTTGGKNIAAQIKKEVGSSVAEQRKEIEQLNAKAAGAAELGAQKADRRASAFESKEENQARKDAFKKFIDENNRFAKEADKSYKETSAKIIQSQKAFDQASARNTESISRARNASEERDFKGKIKSAADAAESEFAAFVAAGGNKDGAAAKALAKNLDGQIQKAYDTVARNAAQTRSQAFRSFGAGQIFGALGFDTLAATSNQIGGTILAFGETIGAASAVSAGFILAGVGLIGKSLAEFSAQAAKFETSQARLSALTDINKNNPGGSAGLAAQSQQLAIGRLTGGAGSAQQIFDASYFIASSGIAQRDVGTVLDASAQGSAAGLGEIKTVADAVTSVLSAYSKSGDQASSITDKFIAIVREGKSEPAQLAKSLGLVLPVAAAAGVSFEELGAQLATITQTGSSTPQAVTQVKQAIASLFDPTVEGRKQLELLGLSVDDVRKKLSAPIESGGGLNATIKDIATRAGGDEAILSNIFGNIRALTGVLSVSRGDFAQYDKTLASIRGSFGDTGKAAEIMAGTLEASQTRIGNSFSNIALAAGTAFNKGVFKGLVSNFEVFIGEIESLTRRATSQGTETDFAGTEQLASSSKLAGLIKFRDEAAGRLNSPLAKSGVGGFVLGAFLTSQVEEFDRAIADETKALEQANVRRLIASSEFKKKNSQFIKDLTDADNEVKNLVKGRAAQDLALPDITVKSGNLKTAFVGEEADRFTAAVKEFDKKRKEAIDGQTQLNGQLASQLGSSIDTLIATANKYDDFFGKFNEISAKLAATPAFITSFVTPDGKRVDPGKQSEADAKKRVALEKEITRRETSERIAAIGQQKEDIARAIRQDPNLQTIPIPPGKKATPQQRENVQTRIANQANALENAARRDASANLTDQQSDIRRDANAKLLDQARKQVQGLGTDITKLSGTNPEFVKLRKELEKLQEQYDEGTFATATNAFQQALAATAGDSKTFNELAGTGGKALSELASQAGLFKSAGFAAAIGEAGLQMKFLRDEAGNFLKGDALVKGFSGFSGALNDFKQQLLDLQPFLTQEVKFTVKTAREQGLISDIDARDRTAVGVKAQVTALQTPEGIQNALLEKFGLDTNKSIEAQIKIQAKLVSGDNEPLGAKIQADVKAALEAEKLIVEIGAKFTDGAIANLFKTEDFKKSVDGLSAIDLTGIITKVGEGRAALEELGKVTTMPKIEAESDVKLVTDQDTESLRTLDRIIAAPKIEATSNAGEVASSAQSSINGVQGKTVTITIITDNITNNTTRDRRETEQVTETPEQRANREREERRNRERGGFASGGRVGSSGYYNVGELGPERVYLKEGQFVMPQNQVNRMNTTRLDTGQSNAGRFVAPVTVNNVVNNYNQNENFTVDARGSQTPRAVKSAVKEGVSQSMLKRQAAAEARSRGQR